MTREEALKNLRKAVADAIAPVLEEAKAIEDAMEAFSEVGLEVTGLALHIGVTVAEIRADSPKSNDADFLRSLRIVPDLNLGEPR